MYNSQIPNANELPSTSKLIKATVIALIVSFLIAICIVMPAEFGKDPTGVGTILGLTKMGEIKESLAQEEKLANNKDKEAAMIKEEVSLTNIANSSQGELRNDEITITLAPNESAEVKVVLKNGKKVNYKWSSTGKTNFDVHADSKELKIDYHGYTKGSKVMDEGVITAAFDGEHGWFWRNRNEKNITINLSTNGEYNDIIRKK